MNLQDLIGQVTGGGNAEALGQAADDHVSSMPPEDVAQHLQTAATNARQSGQDGVAQEIEGMIARRQVDPEALKNAAVSYIKSNPEVLTHFAPSFAQGILNRAL